MPMSTCREHALSLFTPCQGRHVSDPTSPYIVHPTQRERYVYTGTRTWGFCGSFHSSCHRGFCLKRLSRCLCNFRRCGRCRLGGSFWGSFRCGRGLHWGLNRGLSCSLNCSYRCLGSFLWGWRCGLDGGLSWRRPNEKVIPCRDMSLGWDRTLNHEVQVDLAELLDTCWAWVSTDVP
jgi:hypothetical protein